MKHGDFTMLAKQYVNRPGYSVDVINALMSHTGTDKEYGYMVADVGAGTGKLTEMLAALGLRGYAVEPNDAMREEAVRQDNTLNRFKWMKGFAEETGLGDRAVKWVFMASSFHWTDKKAALNEFHRILDDGGFFTALWNPRDIGRSEQHQHIESIVHHYVPELKRVSSGLSSNMSGVEEDLVQTGQFGRLIFMEAPHTVQMTKERYLNAWRSVNDIQVQAGPERFERIMTEIDLYLGDIDTIDVPYKTRAWTVQAL